jgi:hypothetical protein
VVLYPTVLRDKHIDDLLHDQIGDELFLSQRGSRSQGQGGSGTVGAPQGPKASAFHHAYCFFFFPSFFGGVGNRV